MRSHAVCFQMTSEGQKSRSNLENFEIKYLKNAVRDISRTAFLRYLILRYFEQVHGIVKVRYRMSYCKAFK